MLGIVTGLTGHEGKSMVWQGSLTVRQPQRPPSSPLVESRNLVLEFAEQRARFFFVAREESIGLLSLLRQMDEVPELYIPEALTEVQTYCSDSGLPYKSIPTSHDLGSSSDPKKRDHLIRKSIKDYILENFQSDSEEIGQPFVFVGQVPVLNLETGNLKINFDSYWDFVRFLRKNKLSGAPNFFLANPEVIWSFYLLPNHQNALGTEARRDGMTSEQEDSRRVVLEESGFADLVPDNSFAHSQSQIRTLNRRGALSMLAYVLTSATFVRFLPIFSSGRDLQMEALKRSLFQNHGKRILVAEDKT